MRGSGRSRKAICPGAKNVSSLILLRRHQTSGLKAEAVGAQESTSPTASGQGFLSFSDRYIMLRRCDICGTLIAMRDWGDLVFFLALMRRSTLRGAARELGVAPTTVSRRLASLEATLGAPLF